MPTQQVIQVLDDFLAAIGRGDADAVDGMFTHTPEPVFYGTHTKLHFTNWADLRAALALQSRVDYAAWAIDGDVHVRFLAGGSVAVVSSAALRLAGLIGSTRFDLAGLRVTCAMERVEAGWLIAQLHISVSDDQFLARVLAEPVTYF